MSIAVVMPYAKHYDAPRKALLHAAERPLFFDVGNSDYAYAQLVCWLWTHREGFILVEHDIVVEPGMIDELLACSEDWCGFPYLEVPNSQPVTGLGCTKLSRRLVRSLPCPVPPDTIWQNVDASVGPRLRELGFTIHVHQPPVRNLSVEGA